MRISKISSQCHVRILRMVEFCDLHNAALYWRIPPLIIMQLSVHYASRDYAEFNLDQHPASPFTPTTALNLRLRSRGNVLDCGIGRSPHKYNCTNVQVIIM